MKNINEKIIGEYNQIAESPTGNVWEKIERGIETENNETPKRPRKFLLKPLIAAAVCVALVTTAFAAAPLIFKMIGSNIGFFNTEKQTRYSQYQEMLKEYSAEVNITQELDGISFTIDNIAVDDNFINIFYTIKSEYNLYEYIQGKCNEYYKKGDGSMWWLKPDMHEFTIKMFTPLLDYRLPDITADYGENYNNYKNFDSLDSYVVSDYEIKGAQKMLISEELPEVFTLEIFSSKFHADTIDIFNFINVPLTIDRTAAAIKTINIYPNVSGIFTGEGGNYGGGNGAMSIREDDFITHDVTVKKVSLSPLGNVIVFEERAEKYRSLFNQYALMDDKGNYLRRNVHIRRDRPSYGEQTEETFADEIFGIDETTEYLKLIPYTTRHSYEWTDDTKLETGEYFEDVWNDYADKDSLPKRLRFSNKGVLTVESIEMSDNVLTVVYSLEGVGDMETTWLNAVYYEDKTEELRNINTQMMLSRLYDSETKKYTETMAFTESDVDMNEYIKGVSVRYSEIDLLEDEAIIIPLK